MIDLDNIKKFFHWFYFAVCALDLIAIVFSIYWMELLFKPMIMLSLIALYLSSSERRNVWYFLALLFSLLGDIYLLDKTNMFLFGLGCFLCAQLLFIYIIWRDLPTTSWSQRIFAMLPFAVYLILLMSLLSPDLGGFIAPVWLYGVVISIFGAISLLNHLVRKSPYSRILLMGAILFILSDSMIAIHKFYFSIDYYPVAIMLTYVLAQYFIFHYMLAVDNQEEIG